MAGGRVVYSARIWRPALPSGASHAGAARLHPGRAAPGLRRVAWSARSSSSSPSWPSRSCRTPHIAISFDRSWHWR